MTTEIDFNDLKKEIENDILPQLTNLGAEDRGKIRNYIRGAAENQLRERLTEIKKELPYITTDYDEVSKKIRLGSEHIHKQLAERKEEMDKEVKNSFNSFGRWGQAEEFYKHQPFFYDENKRFWFWNSEKFCYETIDEITILNKIRDLMKVGIIETKSRTEILNVLKQLGRKYTPSESKNTWIQFKNKIYDIETDEIMEAEPKHFVTNPIMFDVGDSEDTPKIDNLFISWVGEEHKQELYEILAFCCVPQYFIHRVFFFFGSGANGKSTFDKLLEKFIGSHNVTSSSIEMLMNNPRFETTKFHKKLVVTLSETEVDEIKKSDILKRGSGEDSLPAEYKGGALFDIINYAKFLIPTNKIPKSEDDSDGFFRRVKIIDFPNTFTKEKDVLSKIPEEEYRNLAKKCLRLAKKLYIERIFTNDGDFNIRRQRYNERAITQEEIFISKECVCNDSNDSIDFSTFYISYLSFLKKNNKNTISKIELSKRLKKLGWEIRPKNVKNEITNEYTTSRHILGLTLKRGVN
ncbi:MAG: phage/plasmid primase, P4 family [Candidatus Woesearchaeota archaeon]